MHANKDQLVGVRGIAFDAFGTTLTGAPMASFLPWHRDLPAAERRAWREAWMRGEVGPVELAQAGDAAAAHPPAVLAHRLRAGLADVAAYPDVPDVLEALQARGYRMVTISNLVEPFGEALAQRLGQWMEGFVLSYEHGALKPDQSLFRAAAEILDLPPRQVVVVGDSVAADVRGAQSVGMPSILVDRRGEQPDSIATLEPLLDCLPGL